MSLFSMEKDKPEIHSKLLMKKNSQNRFLFKFVVVILRCISSRVLDFCSPSDEIPYPRFVLTHSLFTRYFFVHSDHCESFFFVRTRVHPEHVSYLSFLLHVDSKEKKHLRCRSWRWSCRSSTRYGLIRDVFVEMYVVVFRIRILIVEFSNDVLFFLLSLLFSRLMILHIFLITYGARLQDSLNMRLNGNSSSLLCQKNVLVLMSLI